MTVQPPTQVTDPRGELHTRTSCRTRCAAAGHPDGARHRPQRCTGNTRAAGSARHWARLPLEPPSSALSPICCWGAPFHSP